MSERFVIADRTAVAVPPPAPQNGEMVPVLDEGAKEAGKKPAKEPASQVGPTREAIGGFMVATGAFSTTFLGSIALGFGAFGIALLCGADASTANNVGFVTGVVNYMTDAVARPLYVGAGIALREDGKQIRKRASVA